jgi:5-methyltetrahydropteroyltriglutamate--homocysteine methyltransferase
VVAPASALPYPRDDHYGNDEKMLWALADALRNEYQAIVDAGLYVQIDDAFLPYMHEKMVPPKTLKQYLTWAELRIAALNHALKGIPEDRARYHICWGSWNGPHVFDVPIKDILPLLLKIKVGTYSFEAANPRHQHEWQAWKTVKVPKGKTLMPGVVTHSTNIVEHPELVAERLMRYAGIRSRGASIRRSSGRSSRRWPKAPRSRASACGARRSRRRRRQPDPRLRRNRRGVPPDG